MGHRIGIWLVCQLLYCLYSCVCVFVYSSLCVCVCGRLFGCLPAFVLFHSKNGPIIVQPNITDLILDRTTEWPDWRQEQEQGGMWMRMATWFLQQISLFRYCVKTQHYSKFMRQAYSLLCPFSGGWIEDGKRAMISNSVAQHRHWLWHTHPHPHPHPHSHWQTHIDVY